MSLIRNAFRVVLNTNRLYQPCPVPSRSVKRWVMPTMREQKRRKDRETPKPIQRSTFIEWNYKSELFAFGQRLGEHFNPELLQQAFTQRSYIVQEELRQQAVGIDQPETNLLDNKSLVAKGESVLSDSLKIFLEAQLTSLPQTGQDAVRAFLMSEEILANVASHLGCSDLVLSSEFPVSSDVLADTMKAVIGALVESSDANQAFNFVRDFVCTQLNQKDINELWEIEQPLALLTELCEDRKLSVPEPRLIGEAGKNTLLATYHVGIYVDKQLLGTGFGENVDTAIETAARHCLAKLFGTDNLRPFNYKITSQLCLASISQRSTQKQIQ